MNTQKMLPAAFETGDTVEYIGERHHQDEKKRDLLKKGMQFEIIDTIPPKKGRGYMFTDEDGEKIFDHDTDGYNIYKSPYYDQYAIGGIRKKMLWPSDAATEWKLVKKKS